jgi:rhodanese-related sulfurtransferase
MTQEIGFFQFDNLVKGRIPFRFVNLGIDTDAVYPHIYKSHLERLQLQVPEGRLQDMPPHDVVAQLQSQGVAAGDAIILLCEDGEKSEAIAEALDRAGFLNVFLVRGGWEKLLEERASS